MRSSWAITNFERMENNPFTESSDLLFKYLSARYHSRVLPSRSQPAQVTHRSNQTFVLAL